MIQAQQTQQQTQHSSCPENESEQPQHTHNSATHPSSKPVHPASHTHHVPYLFSSHLSDVVTCVFTARKGKAGWRAGRRAWRWHAQFVSVAFELLEDAVDTVLDDSGAGQLVNGVAAHCTARINVHRKQNGNTTDVTRGRTLSQLREEHPASTGSDGTEHARINSEHRMTFASVNKSMHLQ